jgi:hypothetical protein
MTEKVENLILERLRRIEDKLDGEIVRGRETRERLGHMEEGLASLSRRIDRIDDRLDRIERRLELQEVR